METRKKLLLNKVIDANINRNVSFGRLFQCCVPRRKIRGSQTALYQVEKLILKEQFSEWESV